jgi:DNA excision repair protein ERCC-2
MTEQLSSQDFFPYQSMRKGQKEMMLDIETATSRRKNAALEAPNGFGKTCVTLCGVLPWVKKNRGKVLYCARTHRQLDRVMEELVEISKLQDVTGVSFRGRRHMCLNPFVLENAGIVAPISEVCGQLKATGRCAYYEKLRKLGTPEELLEDLSSKVMTAPEIIKYAKKEKICPYELSKKLAKVVDVVALSYLYVFDPFIMETFLPELETPTSRMVLVQDEAHNVPSTALDSASDSLSVSVIRGAMREAATWNDSTAREYSKALAKVVLELSTGMSENEELVIDPQHVYKKAVTLSGLSAEIRPIQYMKSLGFRIRKSQLKAGKFPRSYIGRVGEFMERWSDLSGRDDYTFILTSSKDFRGNKRISLDAVALDPTHVTGPILERVHNSVAVSGTISPLDAYSDMLGFKSDAITSTFTNPFATRNRMALVIEGLDTSYKNRTKAVFERYVDYCVAVAHATPSNTGIFATSYGIVKSLLNAGLEKRLKKKLLIEKPGMKGTENDKVVEEFKKRGERDGAVLLGVQGGRNSEGGDFPGKSMESVIVVGVPYARPTPRTEALIKYFDYRFNGKGRDYAYVLPAMTRAIQAAGRPVRRLDDCGAIILLDQRFATPYLKRFLPSWLMDVVQMVPDSVDLVAQQVESFFSD